MSKFKRARRYIGKRLRGRYGKAFLVQEVVVALKQALPGFSHALYHPNSARDHALAFKGPDGYMAVNSRVRHDVVDELPVVDIVGAGVRRARILLRRMEADRAELDKMSPDVMVQVDALLGKGK